MEYRATFGSLLGLTFAVLFVASLCIAVGIQTHAFGLIPVGALLLFLLLSVRLRFRVVIGDEEIITTGFFKTERLRFADITSARWMTDRGYPWSRLYGPFVYEIRSPGQTLRINFKLFPLDCMDAVRKRIEEQTVESSAP